MQSNAYYYILLVHKSYLKEHFVLKLRSIINTNTACT